MLRLPLLRNLTLLVCLFALTIGAKAQPPLRVISTMDYQFVMNCQISILARVNSDVQARFLLDTGWNRSGISAAIKDKLNIPTRLVFVETGKPFYEATAPMLAVGSLIFNNFDFVVMPDKEVKASLSGAVDGILGTDVLEKCATLIDPITKKVTFWYLGKVTKEELKAVSMEDAMVIPIIKKEGRFCIRAGFNGKVEDNAVLDIGSERTHIAAQLNKKLKLNPLSLKGLMRTERGTAQIDCAVLQSLTLGKAVLSNFTVDFSTLNDQWSMPNLIGMDALLHFRFVIDIPAKKLYLKPIPDNTKPDESSTKH